jgi:hypothetical protein
MRAQFLPDSLLAKIPSSFWLDPVASPFSLGSAKVFEDLRHPSERIIDFDEELLRALLREGIERFPRQPDDFNRLDTWLAPRVHNVVRVPRRITADRLFWAWVAIEFGREYVRHRWAPDTGEPINNYRLTGSHLRNGVSRLWWAAELARNGRDYGPVDLVLRGVRVAQFALELRYSWYRPAVIAFAKVCSDRKLGDLQMKAMSVRLNAYLGTRPVEIVGLDEKVNEDYDAEWWSSVAPSKHQLFDGKMEGPDDGYAAEEAITALVKWFGDVLDELLLVPMMAVGR